ncbi:hypothetical protein L3X38_037036 [Prunus dulcis]|uniref:Uncharacterized protein n=1 Tax=Prunus dulcis TaxID=3755 RepID=A0AAD4V3V4_PRUDU|nr:hypothetical protein L3X38_037036 [Prunus dulcis]
MWQGNKPSNWGTNSQPENTVKTLKTCTLENQSYVRKLPNQGPTATPVKDALVSDISKYLTFLYPSSKSGEDNAQYAKFVRGSNVNRIGIRKYLRARENQEITLGHNEPFSIAAMRRHTCRQCVGVQSDNTSLENLNIIAQDSYPRRNTLFGITFVLGPTPISDRKWPES